MPAILSVDDLCFLQSGQDQRDEDQLGDDARHGGEQGTGQKRAEREAAAGQACQHEAHSTPTRRPATMAVTRAAYIMGRVCFTLRQTRPDTRP